MFFKRSQATAWLFWPNINPALTSPSFPNPAAAAAQPCAAHTEELSTALPSRFDAAMQDEMAALAETLGLPAMRLLSMAGHAERFLAPICPSAMLFIPCLGGVTHHPAESMTPADALAGARLVAAAVARWSA